MQSVPFCLPLALTASGPFSILEIGYCCFYNSFRISNILRTKSKQLHWLVLWGPFALLFPGSNYKRPSSFPQFFPCCWIFDGYLKVFAFTSKMLKIPHCPLVPRICNGVTVWSLFSSGSLHTWKLAAVDVVQNAHPTLLVSCLTSVVQTH